MIYPIPAAMNRMIRVTPTPTATPASRPTLDFELAVTVLVIVTVVAAPLDAAVMLGATEKISAR